MMVGIVASRATRPGPKDLDAAAMNGSEMPIAGTARSLNFEPLFDAPDFSLTDQAGNLFTKKNLLGNVWVADFIFTQCGGPCPRMSGKMAALQDSVKNKDVRFVSFSVDPQHDTPEVLSEYAKRFNADTSRWTFLTGPKGAIFEAAAGMRLSAIPASADEPISHSTKFLVVDRHGKVVAIYSSGDEAEMKQLADDLRTLANRK